ncbi:unnamed protein product, partial [Porites evermanni]
MGKNVDLKISFSRESKHYHPGEVVSGECVLLLNDHLKLRCVSIEFQGESWTYWEETNLYTSIHKNAEIYFHKKTTLFGDLSKVKFTLSLPFDCFVRKVSKYLLRIGIFKPFEALTSLLLYALAARFRSLSIDLMHHVFRRFWKLLHFIKNNMQIFLIFMPTFGEAQKSLNCLCNGMASPLKLITVTDRSAYCPRERVMLTTDIKNLPLTKTYYTSIFLMQTITFKSRCGKLRTERCQRKLIQRSSLSWAVDELEVPDVPPTMKSCGILSITYHIKVVLTTGESKGSNLEVELPITIGTVPLRRSYGMINRLMPLAHLSRSYSGESKTFVTIKRG